MSIIDHSVDTDPAADDVPDEPVVRGGVRWKRFGGMLAVTGAMAIGMVVLTAQGVLAAQFSISGMPFVITASKLEGTGFQQYARLRETEKQNPSNPGYDPDKPDQNEPEVKLTMVSAIRTAKLSDLCQSVDLGGGFLKITAGDQPGKPVEADTLVVDSDEISGDGYFTGMDIGQDASTLDKVPGVKGGIGTFGQQADRVEIKNLRQKNWATTAATFRLTHLRMGFDFNSGC